MGNGTQQSISAPPVAPASSPPQGAGGTTSTPAPVTPWYGDLSNEPDLKGYAELKGWKSPAEALKSYRDAEKLIGAPKDQLLRLPGADAKPEDWNPVYDRLGRPATAADYKLPTVEGGEEFAGKMAPLLHSAGLSQQQVTTIANGWNEYMKGAVEATDRAQEQREQVDLQSLHTEWPGDVFTQREDMARRAVREFVGPIAGDDAATVQLLGQIEDSIGTAKFLKIFANIGEKLSEAKYVGGNANNGVFGMTPAAANERIQQLKADKDWAKKYITNPKGPEGQEFDRLVILASKGR